MIRRRIADWLHARWGTPAEPKVCEPVAPEKRKRQINPMTLAIAARSGRGADGFLSSLLARRAVRQRARAFRELFPIPARPPGAEPMATDQAAALDDAYSFASVAEFGDIAQLQAFLGFPILAELAQRSEYRNISETIAKEMTRKWVKITTTSTDAAGAKKRAKRVERLEQLMKEHDLKGVFRKAAEHDGFFGRGHIYIDTGDTDNASELGKPLIFDKRKIPKGTRIAFRTVEPIWVYPDQYNATDPLKPDYYRPTSWFVMNKRVHSTRLLTLISREIPDLFKPSFAFSGLSLSQMARPYVENWLRTRQSVSDLLASFSQMVLKTDMSAELEGEVGAISDRLKLFNLFRSNSGSMAIDKSTEELENVSTPLGTLDALQAQSQEQMASVAQEPLVKLFGITPTGLNASSDGEIRVFYDGVNSRQEHIFERPLKSCLDALQLAEFGDIDPAIGFEFVSLWELDEAARASVQKTQADAAAVYVEAGVVSAEEERERIARDPEGLYHGVDLSGPPPEPDEDGEGEEDVPGGRASAGGDPAKGSIGSSGV